MSCPHCHGSARFVGYRPKTLASLIGTIGLERAYYHCRHCGQGAVPPPACAPGDAIERGGAAGAACAGGSGAAPDAPP